MQNIDQLRNEILNHKEDICQKKFKSPYFKDFLSVGFLDFFLLSYGNIVTFEHQENIIKSLEQGKSFEHFFEYFSYQLQVTFDDLLDIFFLAMNTMKNSSKFMRLYIMHISNIWKVELLYTVPHYFDYIASYAVNPDTWREILDIMVSTACEVNSQDYYSLLEFLQSQIQFFTEDIKQSIWMTIGLEIGVLLYSPTNNKYNYLAFVNWIEQEIQKKKAQNRALKAN